MSDCIEWPMMIEDGFAWGIGWTTVYAAVAFGLLLLTLATFDRCFGRV